MRSGASSAMIHARCSRSCPRRPTGGITGCAITTLLTTSIVSFVSNDPAPVLTVLPTEADARDYMVSDVEPIFAATPVLRGALAAATDEDRNTLLSRRFPGGSLKVVAAKA